MKYDRYYDLLEKKNVEKRINRSMFYTEREVPIYACGVHHLKVADVIAIV